MVCLMLCLMVWFKLQYCEQRTIKPTILDKSPFGQYYSIHIFVSFHGSLLKQHILFEIFLQFSLPQPKQSWNSKKILDTRIQHCLWDEGRGWSCVNWKTPWKRKRVPRLWSMIVDRKEAFEDYKNIFLWKTQNLNFSKGISPSFLSKIWHLLDLDFYAK